MKKFTQRVIALLVAAMVAISIPVMAETESGENGRKITFPDTITHWSQKHVAKLAALDIVKGQSNGNYGVDDTISQQEVIVMAVRLMGKEEEASKVTGNTGTSLETDHWARDHVVYALREGILQAGEEIKDNGHVKWGTRSAKREWVAKVMVRALGKEEEAAELAGEESGFRDHEDISEDALGYVNAAVDLDIITGTTTNDFLPLKTITRAETASIFAKALSHLPENDNVTVGRVSAVSDTTLTVRDSEGDLQRIGLGNQTAYYQYDGNFQVLKSAVKQGVEVYVIHDDGQAIYVEVTDEEEPMDVINGIVDKVSISANIITITTDDGDKVSYMMEDNVAVLDADGRGSSLSQIVSLSKVTLKKNTVTNRIAEIQIMDEPISKQAEGIVVSISKNKLVVHNVESDEEETYPISELLEITYENETLDLEEVQEQDKISYTIDYGYVTEIDILQPYIEPENGKVVSIDYVNRFIVLDSGGPNPSAYYYTDDVRVKLEGMLAPTLDDVMPQDEVAVEFDESGKITVITIKNRNLASSQMLTYIAYLEDENQIVVLDHDKSVKSFKLMNDTVLEISNEEYPIEELSERLKANTTRVDLTLTGEYVRRITVSNGYTGIVDEINASSGVLKITNPTLGSLEFKLSSSTRVEFLDDTSSRLSRLKIGDEVEVVLNDDQKEVSRIRVKQNVYHVIESIRESNGRVILEDLDGDTERIIVNDSYKLTHPSEPYVYFDDLKEGLPVTVSYFGKRDYSINLLETIYGTIVELNRANDTLVIETALAEELTINTAKNFTLLDGRLTNLREGDRISIMQDIDGYTFAEGVTRRVKEFYRLESGNRIAFTNPLNEIERYDLADHVIVHKDHEMIKLDELKKRDRLNVYIVNGVIVEIEVQ